MAAKKKAKTASREGRRGQATQAAEKLRAKSARS